MVTSNSRRIVALRRDRKVHRIGTRYRRRLSGWTLSHLAACAALFAGGACGGGPSGAPPSCAGQEDCECRPDRTCDEGLTCASNTCVDLGDPGGAAGSGTADGGQPDGGSSSGGTSGGGKAGGGAAPNGGEQSAGGTVPSGDAGFAGSSDESGGSTGTGGNLATGGDDGTGSAKSTGGAAPTGGASPEGGESSNVGGVDSGGTAGAGGAAAQGGTATGGSASGGTVGGGNDLAAGKPTSADGQTATDLPQYANDGDLVTRWCAANGMTGHYWTVDLGAVHELTGIQITWEFDQTVYGYIVELSDDGNAFLAALDNTANAKTTRTQTETLSASGRYVRILVTGLPPPGPVDVWACLADVKVYGS